MYPTGSHAPPEKGGQYPPPQGGGFGAYPPPSGGAYPPPPGGAPGYPGGGYGAPPGGYGAPPGGGYGAPPGGYGAPPGGYGAPQGGYGGYGPPPGTGPVGPPPGGYAPPPMGNMGNFGPQPTGPIFNPPIPFQAPFPGGAHPGRSIIVKGVITGDDGFTLNFKCGEENNFHFNPRPNQGCVVYNHNQHGWGTEERHQNPFHPGQPFELCITIEPNQYKVFVNHQPFPSFNARMFPIEKFELIQIGGSVNVQEINFS